MNVNLLNYGYSDLPDIENTWNVTQAQVVQAVAAQCPDQTPYLGVPTP